MVKMVIKRLSQLTVILLHILGNMAVLGGRLFDLLIMLSGIVECTM